MEAHNLLIPPTESSGAQEPSMTDTPPLVAAHQDQEALAARNTYQSLPEASTVQDTAGEGNARHSAAERQSPEHPHAQPDSHIHRMNAQSPEQTAMDCVPAVAGHGGTPIVVSGGVAALTPSAEGSISLGDGNAAVITSAAPLVSCSAASVSLEAEAQPMEVDAHVEAVARGGAMSSVMAASGVDVPCHVLPAPEFQEPLCEQDAAEVERRAKRRRLHEGSLASRQHSELRRRLVDAVCELEISGNEVARLRSLSAAPSVGAEQEVALAPEHRGRLEANHRRRLQELAQRACLNLVKGLMKHHWAVPFNTPVDTSVYTAYLAYIETPMDFSTVRRKCESGAYTGPDDVAADMRLVFSNARSYNKPGTDVFVMASTLQEKFEDKWQAHVLPKLREEVVVQHREEADTLRSLRAAAVASRGERLAAQSEAISSALARLGVRLREAQSLAALHCKPLTLPEKDELARVLPLLTQEHFDSVMSLVVSQHPEIKSGKETVVDMDRLDSLTLRQMQRYIRATGVTDLSSSAPDESPDVTMSWPNLIFSAGLRAYRPQGSRKEKQLAAERAQILEPSLLELQTGVGPEKSASAGCVDFSFPPTKLSPGVAKPPLFLAPQKRTPTSTPDSAAGLKAEARDMRLERQLTTQSSGVGSKASVSAAAAVQRYNSRNASATPGTLLRCGSSVGEVTPAMYPAVSTIAAVAAATDQRRLFPTWSSSSLPPLEAAEVVAAQQRNPQGEASQSDQEGPPGQSAE